MNHNAKVCWHNRNSGQMNWRNRAVNAVGEQDEYVSVDHGDGGYGDYDDIHDDTELNIGALTVSPVSKQYCNNTIDKLVNTKNELILKEWTEIVNIEKIKVTCKVDSGAECNVMSKSVLDSIIKNPNIKECKTVLKAYGGSSLPILGKIGLNCKLNGIHILTEFFIVPFKAKTVLGLDSSFRFELLNPTAHQTRQNSNVGSIVNTYNSQHSQQLYVNLQGELLEKSSTEALQDEVIVDHVECKKIEEQMTTNLKKKFHKLFDTSAVGCLKNGGCTIRLRDGAEPVIHASRRVSFALQPELKKELERMEKLGVILKVDEPTDWVSSMVVVKQPHRLRLCLDPTDLNKNIMREHTHLPTEDETLSSITNAKVFSKLDLKNGYWQLPLDTESSYLTTFNTPFGRYRFTRLPFGLCSANEIFQKRMTQLFDSLPGVIILYDDILVYAENYEEHLKRLNVVLQKALDAGIKLNEEKCMFFCIKR